MHVSPLQCTEHTVTLSWGYKAHPNSTHKHLSSETFSLNFPELSGHHGMHQKKSNETENYVENRIHYRVKRGTLKGCGHTGLMGNWKGKHSVGEGKSE